jgi:hypothetical protein
MTTLEVGESVNGKIIRANDGDRLRVTLSDASANGRHWFPTSVCPGTLTMLHVSCRDGVSEFLYTIKTTPTTLQLEYRRPNEAMPSDTYTLHIV